MLGLSAAFMLMTFVVFTAYGTFASSVRRHVISRPRVVARIRRTFALSFVALSARLAVTSD
jgi:threonine/homoserine/homoserine lactone efflux protein